MSAIPFSTVGRLPASGDNVAIATRKIASGTEIDCDGTVFSVNHTVMEGHRFAHQAIEKGAPLLSWGLPFGRALRDIAPGEYVCNERILHALGEREVDFALPSAANFVDHMQRYEIDEETFVPGTQIPQATEPAQFMGFHRGPHRGVGTRNFIIVLSVTAHSAAFARSVAAHYQAAGLPQGVSERQFDGVVAVTHTEGDSAQQNNLNHVLRTLAGFMVHPNVGAVLAVDYGIGNYDAQTLRTFISDQNYAIDDVPHRFMQIASSTEQALNEAIEIIDGWLPDVTRMQRASASVANLGVALQCGGSDAFSGVSGNALAGWVAKEVIRNGGRANLAETDELIGAEPYVLNNVRDLATARAFLTKIDQFKAYAADHGASAEGNPSGGNNYRGLYNIALKSIGAARKRDPDVRLDAVIDYAAPMRQSDRADADRRGYYFMDSPGNDLESIAGQVASGCNLILFITGNGSITNFPFVPTLKFVTTTGRFEMLENEMDVNAGRYNDGESMDALGQETFELALRIGSGERSKGEQAGHAQVQLWRNWPQTDDKQIKAASQQVTESDPGHDTLPTQPGESVEIALKLYEGQRAPTSDQIGLILPTSLCSGQVAAMIARQFNDELAQDVGHGRVNRYVALVHTEGCGSVNAEKLFLETLAGHLRHDFVAHAVLLEHGCEKVHNDAVALYLQRDHIDPNQFDWASVQLDGGIVKVTDKIRDQFASRFETAKPCHRDVDAGAEALRIAFFNYGEVSAQLSRQQAQLIRDLVHSGATVIMAENDPIAATDDFRDQLLAQSADWRATLAYGQRAQRAGLHVMSMPTRSPSETLTGLGGSGAEIMVAHTAGAPLQPHPMIPLLQLSTHKSAQRFQGDLDTCIDAQTLLAQPNAIARQLLPLITDVANGVYSPKMTSRGFGEFQLTRGQFGVSL